MALEETSVAQLKATILQLLEGRYERDKENLALKSELESLQRKLAERETQLQEQIKAAAQLEALKGELSALKQAEELRTVASERRLAEALEHAEKLDRQLAEFRSASATTKADTTRLHEQTMARELQFVLTLNDQVVGQRAFPNFLRKYRSYQQLVGYLSHLKARLHGKD